MTRLVIRLRQPGEITVGAWTWTVAHNVAVDHLRARRATPTDVTMLDRGVGDGLDSHAIGVELATAVTQSLARLPQRQRSALVAHAQLDGGRGGHALVAANLGVSPKAAESVLARARHSMRRELDRFGLSDAPGWRLAWPWRRYVASSGPTRRRWGSRRSAWSPSSPRRAWWFSAHAAPRTDASDARVRTPDPRGTVRSGQPTAHAAERRHAIPRSPAAHRPTKPGALPSNEFPQRSRFLRCRQRRCPSPRPPPAPSRPAGSPSPQSPAIAIPSVTIPAGITIPSIPPVTVPGVTLPASLITVPSQVTIPSASTVTVPDVTLPTTVSVPVFHPALPTIVR